MPAITAVGVQSSAPAMSYPPLLDSTNSSRRPARCRPIRSSLNPYPRAVSIKVTPASSAPLSSCAATFLGHGVLPDLARAEAERRDGQAGGSEGTLFHPTSLTSGDVDWSGTAADLPVGVARWVVPSLPESALNGNQECGDKSRQLVRRCITNAPSSVNYGERNCTPVERAVRLSRRNVLIGGRP